MKKIKYFILRWRYHRLYRRLFWLYLSKTTTANDAVCQASNAFTWLTGCDWDDWR
jgi:hypothetical protein